MKFENDWFQNVNDVHPDTVSDAFSEIDNLLQKKYGEVLKRIKTDNDFYGKGIALVFVLRQLDETLKACQED